MKYTEKQSVPRENDGNRCVFSLKRLKTSNFTAFMRIFCAFRSVFAELTLFGNDNGEFQVHFVVEQTTQKRDGVCKTFFSRNIPATR